jgi:regulator of cell morphogenesis and NO signaling
METIENILDVTSLPPKDKHPTIFRRFDALEEGETLTIANDHDPKPLYYQMIGERGPVFNWEYLEAGPEWWRVNITKKKQEESTTTVGQLAASDLRKAEVFKKYGIDFCCGGKKTLVQACQDKGLDYVNLEKELRDLEFTRGPRASSYNQWPLDFLADYIVNTHHVYVESALPELRGYAAKVAEVHGKEHPELLRVQELVEEINAELTQHMMKEERVLFPYVKILADAKKKNIRPNESQFGSVKNPIQVMEMEHESAGQILHEIRELTNNYKLPAEACTSYTLLYKLIEEFEDDLHVHIHLENNILFPKAAELEQSFR